MRCERHWPRLTRKPLSEAIACSCSSCCIRQARSHRAQPVVCASRVNSAPVVLATALRETAPLLTTEPAYV